MPDCECELWWPSFLIRTCMQEKPGVRSNECVVVDPSSVGKARGMHAETRTSQLSLFNLDLGRFGFLYDGVGRLFGRERERGGAAIEVMRVCVRPMPWLLLIVVVVEHYCWW